MKRLLAIICLLILSCSLSFISVEVAAEELELVNRPMNTTGLTGLLFTTAPYTLAPKTVEIGAAVLYESSVLPDYSITEFPLVLSAGIGRNMEIGLRGSYFSLKEGPTPTTDTIHGAGDIQLSYKWNFKPQAEYSKVPGAALFITGIFPLENDASKKLDSVSHWGARLGFAIGSELSWKDHLIGMYADAQVAVQDVSEERLRDFYGMLNAGLLFPISKYQNLQILVEYSVVNGRNRISRTGGDYTALTYGIRLVSERFNLTMGTQFLNKDEEGFDNSSRVVGVMSMKF